MAARRSVVVVALTTCLVVTAYAQEGTTTTDPIIGTWRMNLTQSRIARPAFTPKEHVEVYRMVSGGRIALELRRTMIDGSPNSFNGTWPAQGGVIEEQANALKGSLMVETLVAPGEWWVTQMVDGKQVATIHKVVSKDRKTMRQMIKGLDPQGKSFEQIQVFDRQ